jgi:hypothetical protein
VSKEEMVELDQRIAVYRRKMNDDQNEPALRYMASGAFEALREFRTHAASMRDR